MTGYVTQKEFRQLIGILDKKLTVIRDDTNAALAKLKTPCLNHHLDVFTIQAEELEADLHKFFDTPARSFVGEGVPNILVDGGVGHAD